MSKILTEELIPSLKDKIIANSSDSLKVYDVEASEDGVLSINDTSLPSVPTQGLHFIIRPTAAVNNPTISLNGSAAKEVYEQLIGGGRKVLTSMSSYDTYELVMINNIWRCLNVPAKVTAAGADIAGIMNSAGDNGELFGLGGNCLLLNEGLSLNNVPNKTGFYRIKNPKDNPITVLQYSDWWYIEQMVHSDGHRVQVIRSLQDARYVYQRVQKNGTWGAWQRILTSATALDQIYPVGSMYISYTLDTAEKVAAALGGGSWLRSAEGNVMVGYNSADTDFNAVTKTGGTKTVTLLKANLPAYDLASSGVTWGGGHSGSVAMANSQNTYCQNAWKGEQVIRTGGSDTPHNNLQPYTVRYMYRRTA